jgi:hypothetical protein
MPRGEWKHHFQRESGDSGGFGADAIEPGSELVPACASLKFLPLESRVYKLGLDVHEVRDS